MARGMETIIAWLLPFMIGVLVLSVVMQLLWAWTISAIAEKTGQSELMQVLARACGHAELSGFTADDITTWKRDMAELSGVRFAGVGNLSVRGRG